MKQTIFWTIVATSFIFFLGVLTLYDVIKKPHFGPIIWSEKQDYPPAELSQEDKDAIAEIQHHDAINRGE